MIINYAIVSILITLLVRHFIEYFKLKKKLLRKESENITLRQVLADEGLIPKDFIKKEGKKNGIIKNLFRNKRNTNNKSV